MAIKYAIESHATAYPSRVLAAKGGEHIYNIELSTDTDNGNLIAKGDYVSLDLYEEAAVTSFTGVIRDQATNGNWYVEVVTAGDALLVYTTPVIAEEFTNKFKAESNFYNQKGGIARAYGLHAGDLFEVSAAAFSGTPTVGAKINAVASKKMVVATA